MEPFSGKIRVLDRLKSLIPALEEEQVRSLEQSLIDEGRAYNALWVWGDILVDGHHRLELCEKHNLPYEAIQVYQSAETIEDVEYRMKRDAIGRRNLLPAVQSRFRAEMVAYHISKGKGKKAAVKTVAKDANVSDRQVYRDVKKAEFLEKVDDEVKPVADTMSADAVEALSELPQEEQKAEAKKAGGNAKKLSKAVRKKKGTANLTHQDAVRMAKNLAHQHRDKLILAIDDYANLEPNHAEQDRLVRLVASVKLW